MLFLNRCESGMALFKSQRKFSYLKALISMSDIGLTSPAIVQHFSIKTLKAPSTISSNAFTETDKAPG